MSLLRKLLSAPPWADGHRCCRYGQAPLGDAHFPLRRRHKKFIANHPTECPKSPYTLLVDWYSLGMILEIITAISGISVVLSLIFATGQTRELTKQTKLNNHIETLGSMHDSLEMLHEIQAILIDKPELRPYFYKSKPCPSKGQRRKVVINIAEMLADTIDYGLMVVQLMPGTK
jgi:hypothetical protein